MRASILDCVAWACTLIDDKPLGEMVVFVEMLLNMVVRPGVFVDLAQRFGRATPMPVSLPGRECSRRLKESG
jgi:hypothetical protein